MSSYVRAMTMMASLEALAEERREIIAERVIAVLVELAGGVELSEEEFAALEARLVQEDRLPSDEEVEAMFKTLLR